MSLIAFYLLALFQLSISLAPNGITILILSQQDAYNRQNAEQLKRNIISQANQTQLPNVYLSHEIFADSHGSWAITPILMGSQSNYNKMFTVNTEWLVLCEDDSLVNLPVLIESLSKENSTAELFLGYPLIDREATIIHHFAFFDNPSWFQYPLFRAGVAFTRPLLNRLSNRLKSEKFSTDFFIDASHELSLFAWNNGKGHKLTVAPYFCLEEKTGCAVYGKPHSTCNKTVAMDKIFFAVKTCKKFHNDRVPIVQKTWSIHAQHIRYYSDVKDDTIPTLSTNVKNTETGHCKKLLAILTLVLRELKTDRNLWGIQWIVLTDDDTLMSIADLCAFLGCYSPYENIYMGERYGYRLLNLDGFNYITGGGGIVFSRRVVQQLVDECLCPSDTSPDDMIIAICLLRKGIHPIHSSKFRQARPVDYPPEMINQPLSFHKFWQIDPIEVYEKWFGSANSNIGKISVPKQTIVNQNKEHLCHENGNNFNEFSLKNSNQIHVEL